MARLISSFYPTGGVERAKRLAPRLSAAEEAGPEAAVLHSVELGFEADPVFGEGRFLLREVHLFLEEALALGLKGCFLLFEGRDRLLLQFALELDEVETFDLGPEAVDLHPRRVALLANLLYLTGPLFEAGLVVLTLLQEALVALEWHGWEPGVAGGFVPHHLALEDLLLCGLGAKLTREPKDIFQVEDVFSFLPAFGAKPPLLRETPDRLWRDVQNGRRPVEPDDLLAPVHESILL